MTGYYTKPFYQSQKWWAWLLGQGFSLYAASQGLIDWQWVLAPALGFSVGQGLADFGKNRVKQDVAEVLTGNENIADLTNGSGSREAEIQSGQTQQQYIDKPVETTVLMQDQNARFKLESFREAVMHRAKTIYCEDNAADWESDRANWPGRFYSSAMQLALIGAVNINQVLSAWDEHLSIGEKAFEQLFGFNLDSAWEHLNEGKCPARSVRSMIRQRGDAYYAIYLELVRARVTLDELEQIEARGLDWQGVLGARISIYHVGERAGMVLEPDKYSNRGGNLVSRPGIGGASNMPGL